MEPITETKVAENGNGKDEVEGNVTQEVDYDQLLSSAGEFGKHQILLMLICSPFYVFGGFVYFQQMFLTETSPNHWCWIPELENMTALDRRTLAIPSDNESLFGYSRCSAYVANWTEVMVTGEKPNPSWDTQPCQHGWEFNKSEIPYPTIASEQGWVCERDSYQATAQSLFFVGSILGGFLVGWVADRFGRLPAAIFATLIGCVAGIASSFASNFLEFVICRILMGMSYDNCIIMVYLLLLENTALKYRTMITNVTFAVFFTLGVLVLPWIALACGDWKLLALVTSIPLAIAIFAPLVLAESPRWLLAKGKVEEAIKIIKKIGERNKHKVPSKLVEQFRSTEANKKTEEKANLLDLLKRPLLRKMFIILCFEYLCCVIVFDALVRTIGSLKFDFFVSFTVISFTEFPSIMLLSFILDLTGRKWLTVSMMMTCALFSFLTPFVGGGLPSVMCAVVARFTVNMAFNAALQWAAELMPTPIRGSAVSIVHICGYLATVISPFIAYLDTYVSWLSLVIVGCIAFSGACLALFLPETAKKTMPQTFEDADELIMNSRVFEFPCSKSNNAGQETNGHANASFEMN